MKIFKKMMPLAIAAGATIALVSMNSFAAGTPDITNPVGGGMMPANPIVITFPVTENYLDIGCNSKSYYTIKTAGDKKATIIFNGTDENQVLGNLVNPEDKTTPIQTAIEIAPGETFNFYSKGDTGVRVNFTVVYDGDTLKEIPASRDEAKPMDITAGTSVEVPDVSKITYFYYKLHLDKLSRVMIADDSTYKSYVAKPLGEADQFNVFTDYKIDNEKSEKYYEPGDYLIRLDASPNYPGAKFGIKATPINVGTVKCNAPDSFGRTEETSFDVELQGADPDIKIGSVKIVSGEEVLSNDNGDTAYKTKGTAKLVVRKAAKNAVLKITVSGPMRNPVTVFEKPVNVQEASVKNYTVEASYNSITVSTLELSGGKNEGKVALQAKTGGKWKTLQTVPSSYKMTFTKVKPGKKYTLRLVRIVDGVEGAPSKEMTVKTGFKTAPACTISVRKNGTTKARKYWSNGYWSGSVWHRGQYVTVKAQQKIVITVKLKKKIKGIKGLYVKGTKVKGSGTTFKVNTTVPLGTKKTPISVQSYLDEKTGGFSKASTKSISIR